MLKFSNFGKAVVASAPSGTTGLNFTVEAGKGIHYPVLGEGDYFYGIFKDASGNREVVKIEARNTDSMVIAVGGRGLDGTAVRTWAAGDYFVLGMTNIALQETLSNPNLAAFGGVVSAADELAYFTGAGLMAITGFTPFARSLLDDADAATARATLGVYQIPAGSVTDWFQATAPLGWSQVTTHDNKALRIVGGTGAGSGGTVAFSAAFASQAVEGSNSGVALSKAQIPPHVHSIQAASAGTGPGAGYFVGGASFNTAVNSLDGSAGGLLGQAHNHAFTGTPINLAVQYIDMILASKD